MSYACRIKQEEEEEGEKKMNNLENYFNTLNKNVSS